jgi:hypothetical protein
VRLRHPAWSHDKRRLALQVDHVVVVNRHAILDALRDAGLGKDALHEVCYSGRGTYGSTCLGIECDLGDLLLFAAVFAHAAADDYDWLDRVRSDGMGLRTIWYWPDVQIEEEE